MKTSEFFLNAENQHQLYAYEIFNLNPNNNLEIENSAHNIFFIGNEVVLAGIFDLPTFNITYALNAENENNKTAEIFENLNYRFITNEKLDFFNKEKKFIFTKEPFLNESENEVFFATDNSHQAFSNNADLVENENLNLEILNKHHYLLTLELIPIQQQQIFENIKYRFILVNQNFANNINNIELKLDNDCFISLISLIGDVGNETNELKNIELPIKNQNEIALIPFFVNPISGNQKLNFYLPIFNPNQNPNFTDVLNRINNSWEFDLINFLNSEIQSLLLDLIKKTKILMNGFNGWSDQEVNEFKKKYNSNNPEDYANYQISEFINKNQNKSEDFKAKFYWTLLALSSYIKSNWNFKGGLVQEHKLYLNFYLIYDETLNSKFRLASEFLNLKSENNNKWFEAKNDNIAKMFNFSLEDKVLNLNNLPTRLENQIISNNPIDFNQNSFNFNYLANLIIDKSKIKLFNNLFGKSQEKFIFETKLIKNLEANLNRTKTFSLYSGNSDAVIELQEIKTYFSNNKNRILNLIRQEQNIPSNIEILEDFDFLNIKLVKKNLRDFGSSDSSGISDQQYDVWATFDLRIKTKQKINETVDLISPNFSFNYFEWKNFLIQKQLFQNINLIFDLKLEFKSLGWKIKKIRKIEISHILGKEIDLKIGNLVINNLEMFSNKNEFNTKTIIKF